MAKQMQAIHIRWMINRDLTEVCYFSNIDRNTISNTLSNSNVIGLVGEVNEVVVCYCLYELRGNSIRILYFTVHPNYRRQGVASQMIDRIKSKLYDGYKFVNNRTFFKLIVYVPEDQMDALMFFKSHGFNSKLVKGYYKDMDGVKMTYIRSDNASV